MQSLQLEREKMLENHWHCFVALNIIIYIYNTTAFFFLKIKQLYNCWLKMNFNTIIVSVMKKQYLIIIIIIILCNNLSKSNNN
jgi:hypothetical protein